MKFTTTGEALSALLKECEKVTADVPYTPRVQKLDKLVQTIREWEKKPQCGCFFTSYYEGGYGNRTVRHTNNCPIH